MAIRIRRGSGNVFEDVGFPRAEAAHLLIRTDLMLQIARVLKARGQALSAQPHPCGLRGTVRVARLRAAAGVRAGDIPREVLGGI